MLAVIERGLSFGVMTLLLAVMAQPFSAQCAENDYRELLEQQKKETASVIEKQTRIMAEIQDTLDKLNLENRANLASFEHLKNLVETNTASLEERLEEGEISKDKIEMIKFFINHFYARLEQLHIKLPSTSLPQPAAAAAAAPPTQVVQEFSMPVLLLATLLMALAPLGFTLLEFSRVENAVQPSIIIRNIGVVLTVVLAYVGVSEVLTDAYLIQNLQVEIKIPELLYIYQLELGVVICLAIATILSIRIPLLAYVIIAGLIGGVVYPLFTYAIWASEVVPNHQGWLEALGYKDYAGASAIHFTAAVFSLVWLLFGGSKRHVGEVKSSSYRFSYSLLGLFFLWLSMMGISFVHLKDEEQMALLVIKHCLAGAVSGLLTFIIGMLTWKKANRQYNAYIQTLGGVLCGWVAVTAIIESATHNEIIMLAASAGSLYCLAYRLLKWLMRDADPMVAVLLAAHGMGGIWGTLGAALYGDESGVTLEARVWVQLQGLGVDLLLCVTAALLAIMLYRALAWLIRAWKPSAAISSRVAAAK